MKKDPDKYSQHEGLTELQMYKCTSVPVLYHPRVGGTLKEHVSHDLASFGNTVFFSYVEKQVFQLLFYSSSSQLIKLSHLQRPFLFQGSSFWSKNTFVSVEDQDQMEAEIVVMAKLLVVMLTCLLPS